MLFLHEVHQVAGRREEEFEGVYRDGWMPSLAEGDDARLLYFLHHAHGTGRAYNVVTLTVIRPAWGAGRWREVVLWQKVPQLKAITPLVTTEVPPEYRAPGTWMHDALDVRDDWESKLLRTTAWSPFF